MSAQWTDADMAEAYLAGYQSAETAYTDSTEQATDDVRLLANSNAYVTGLLAAVDIIEGVVEDPAPRPTYNVFEAIGQSKPPPAEPRGDR